jgi:hypothetical protein
LLLLIAYFGTKLRKFCGNTKYFPKNFVSSGKSATFAGDFKEITCEDGLHLGIKRAFCTQFASSLHQ